MEKKELELAPHAENISSSCHAHPVGQTSVLVSVLTICDNKILERTSNQEEAISPIMPPCAILMMQSCCLLQLRWLHLWINLVALCCTLSMAIMFSIQVTGNYFSWTAKGRHSGMASVVGFVNLWWGLWCWQWDHGRYVGAPVYKWDHSQFLWVFESP